MSKRYIILLASAILVTTGCNVDKLIDKLKHKYEEITGKGDKRGPKPFTVIFQSVNDSKEAFVNSSCRYNTIVNYTYYETPTDAHARYYHDTRGLTSYPGSGQALKPFWDIRYTNPVTRYIDGGTHLEYANHAVNTGLDARSGYQNVEIGTSNAQTDPNGVVAQAKCVNGEVAAGAIINLYDSPEQNLVYAGPQTTFKYHLARTRLTSPWSNSGSGNMMIQANFDRPIYHNFAKNIGGGVYFGLFLHNKKNGKLLNYVIGIYGIGDAWMKEKAGIRFDPTTGIVHVATVIKDSSWWCTKSPSSMEITEVSNTPGKKISDDGAWNDFFRVNISYDNLKAVLQELKKNPPPEAAGEDFGLNPADWEVTSIMIQYELEEQGGKAMLSGSFKGFAAFVSKLPI